MGGEAHRARYITAAKGARPRRRSRSFTTAVEGLTTASRDSAWLADGIARAVRGTMRTLALAVVLLFTAQVASAEAPSGAMPPQRRASLKRAHRAQIAGLVLTLLGIGATTGGIVPALAGQLADQHDERMKQSLLGGGLIGAGVVTGLIGTGLMIAGGMQEREVKSGIALGAGATLGGL
jgi:hypothetical protein